MHPQDETHRFQGEIEIQRTFKAPSKVATAVIEYALVDGHPKFLGVEVDGEPVPLDYVPESSLLKAYARRRPS